MYASRFLAHRVVRATILVLLWLCVLIAWDGQRRLQFAIPRSHGARQLTLALTALAVLWPLARCLGQRSKPQFTSQQELRHEWVIVTLLFGLGVFLRLVHFSSIPPGMNHDAAWYGMYATHILTGAAYTPYVSAAWGRETLFSYAIAALVAFLGNSPEAVQLASTLFGIAALVPMYVLARALFGPRVGLAALSFFAASGWHGVFTRAGWRVITLPPFACLALYGFWQGFRTRRVGYWVLLGAMCGLTINTYNAGRVVPLMLALLFLVFVFLRWEHWRSWLVGATVAALTFLIVGGPMLWYAARNFEKWQGRAEHLAEQRIAESRTLSNWADAFAMFNYRGNGNDFFIDEPLLEPFAAVFFVLGVAVALFGLRRQENLFLVFGFLLSLLPGVLSVPNGNRCITAMPFVYLFIGLGFSRFAGCCAALVTAQRRRALITMFFIFAPVVATVETYAEFLGPHRRALYGFSPEATAAGEFMRRYMGTHKVYTIAGNWPEYTLTYLSYNGEGDPLERHYVWAHSFKEIEPEIDRFGRKGLLFVLANDDAGREAALRLGKTFAEHRVEVIKARRLGGKEVGRAFFVDAGSLAKSRPWSNASRALLLRASPGGPSVASARLCLQPVVGDQGLSMRFQTMVPEVGTTTGVREVRWLSDCSAAAAKHPLLEFAVAPPGLIARAGGTQQLLVPRAEIESGHWYEIHALMPAARERVAVFVDGQEAAGGGQLRPYAGGVVRIGGVEVWGDHVNEPGGELYVDNIAVREGIARPGDHLWRRAGRKETVAEDFESMPFGPVSPGGPWVEVRGMVTVVEGPSQWRHSGEATNEGTNAFDGGHGTDPGRFNEPMGVAIGTEGDFFISDRLNHRVQKFAADGAFLSAWGELGNGPGEFREPHDLAADDQFLYVADTWNQRVQVFDWHGTFLFEIKDAPPLSSPRGIYARHGRIYVADSGNGVGRVFDRSGKLLLTLGEKGTGPGKIMEPVDVVADSKGRIYLLNSGNNRIDIFASDGQQVGWFPIPNWRGPHLKESYLAIDAGDILYMTDWDLGRVRRFKNDGAELPPFGPTVSRPSGLDTDGTRIIFTARGDDRVRVALIDK